MKIRVRDFLLVSLGSIFFCLNTGYAADLNNPCTPTNSYIDCTDTAEGRRPAEVSFKKIKLNGKRSSDAELALGEPMEITTEIKYNKRAKIFDVKESDNCEPTKKKKRYKPAVTNVTYSLYKSGPLSSSWPPLLIEGHGVVVTNLEAPPAEGSYTVNVTYSTEGDCFCVSSGTEPRGKEFNITVGDKPFVSGIIATRTEPMEGVVETGHYLAKNQQQEFEFEIDANNVKDKEVTWSVEPSSAGSFIGKKGAQGTKVVWRQANNFTSTKEGDVVISANILGADPAEFTMTIFSIDSDEEWGVEPHDPTEGDPIIQQYILSEDSLFPKDADVETVVGIMNANPLNVGSTVDFISLYSRLYMENWDLERGAYLPEKNLQEDAAQHGDAMVVDAVSFSVVDNGQIAVDITTGEALGEIDLVWEYGELDSHHLHINNFPGASDLTGRILVEGEDVEEFVVPCTDDNRISIQIDQLQNVTIEELYLSVIYNSAGDEQKSLARYKVGNDGSVIVTLNDGAGTYYLTLKNEEGEWLDHVDVSIVSLAVQQEIKNAPGYFGPPQSLYCPDDTVVFSADVTPSELSGVYYWETTSDKFQIVGDASSDTITVQMGSQSTVGDLLESLVVSFIPDTSPGSTCNSVHAFSIRKPIFDEQKVVKDYEDLEEQNGLRVYNAWLNLKHPRPLPKHTEWTIRRTDGGPASIGKYDHNKGVITLDPNTTFGTYVISVEPCDQSMTLQVLPPPPPPVNDDDDEETLDDNPFEVWDEERAGTLVDGETIDKRYARNHELEITSSIIDIGLIGDLTSADVIYGRVKDVEKMKRVAPSGWVPTWRYDGESKTSYEVKFNAPITAPKDGWDFFLSLTGFSPVHNVLSVFDEEYHIYIYPNSKKSIDFSITELKKDVNDAIAMVPGLGSVVFFKIDPVVKEKITFSQQWKERPGCHRVAFTCDGAYNISPLAKFDDVKVRLAGGPPLPAIVKQYTDIGLDLVFSGNISMKGSLYKGVGPREFGAKGGVTGTVSLGLEAVAKGQGVVDFTLSGKGGLTFSGGPQISTKKISSDYSVGFSGLDVAINASLFSGRIATKHSWKPIDPRTIWKDSIVLVDFGADGSDVCD